MRLRLKSFRVGIMVGCGWLLNGTSHAMADDPLLPPEEAPTVLSEFDVISGPAEWDETNLGAGDAELRDRLFGNDFLDDLDFFSTGAHGAMAVELARINEPPPVDLVAGETRQSFRGFPTPVLRNGFAQIGMPETLNIAQTINIQGALIPVLGRAAPGGMQNIITARPRARKQLRLIATGSTADRGRLFLEDNRPLRPGKAWQRTALEWQGRTGPQNHYRENTHTVSAALARKHNPKLSTLYTLDLRSVKARAASAIPEYRTDAGGKIMGPWLPLALFNANGPHAWVTRESVAASIQLDSQPSQRVALRASLEGWSRVITQDRFTSSVLNLATGRFQGVREPRHLELPQQAVALRTEGIFRFPAWGSEHKLLASAAGTFVQSHRHESALSVAERNQLPADVRSFDPLAPNFLLPAYDSLRYTRIIADREERPRYLTLELSDRMAWSQGRLVATMGLRYDLVDLAVNDSKPGVPIPWYRDDTSQLSHHLGLNYLIAPSRLLLFASFSTAFDPFTPVDARTGKIQRNETTAGYEAGLRGRFAAAQLEYAVSSYWLFNRHISRNNPLFNDPLADADQTQPQLVAAGEEEYGGGRLELKWAPSETFRLAFRGAAVRAITVASPDLPQEVGRPITRLPPLNLSLNLRHQPADFKSGFYWSAGWQYLAGYTANYANALREELAYPGYGLANLGAGWRWKLGKLQMELDALARNVLDRDLLQSHALLGAQREGSVTVRLLY
jgi:iron complex outermembrane receptor protein